MAHPDVAAALVSSSDSTPTHVFTPPATLHVLDLNSLSQYWFLLLHPFHRSALHCPSHPFIPTLTQYNGVCIWREEGEKQWKHSKSRPFHVVIVRDGSCQRWQLETLDKQKWILSQGRGTAQSNSFFWNVRKMERKRCEEGRRVTHRAAERDKDTGREEDEGETERKK